MKHAPIVHMDSLQCCNLNPEHIRRVVGAILRTCDEHGVDMNWTALEAAQRLLQHAMSNNGLGEDDTLGVSCAPYAWARSTSVTPPFLILELVATDTRGVCTSVGRYVFNVEPASQARLARLARLRAAPQS